MTPTEQARLRRRRAIDAELAADAERTPSFSSARRLAVMALLETHDLGGEDVRFLLAGLGRYEAKRDNGAQAAPGAVGAAALGYPEIFKAYERARSSS
jgi:hypothetical protein